MTPLGPVESFDVVAVGMRAAAFIGALQAAGLSLFLAAHRNSLGSSTDSIMPLGRSLALFGLFLVLGHQFIQAARLAGDWSGVLDSGTQRLNWSQSPGIAALVGGAGLAIEYIGLSWARLPGRPLAVLGALIVAASFAVTGHTTSAQVLPAVRLLLVLHVAIVSYWLGSIVVLRRLANGPNIVTLSDASRSFSASAVWLVPAIFPLGVGMLAGMLPGLEALRSTYGALLATKLAGFSLLIALAAFNRWRAVPALLEEGASALRQYRDTLHAEYLILVAVLSVTAVMTSLFSWH